MRWKDEAIIIATRSYGERKVILSLFTKYHGKRRGLSRIKDDSNHILQVSNILHVEWSARFHKNLGFFKSELVESPSHHFFQDKLKSITVLSFFSVLEKVLPEEEPYTSLYEILLDFINIVKQDNKFWQGHYLNLELSLLTKLGFYLDLSKCAITGNREDLQFISPKTGRAVSKKIGKLYASKLLPFPQMLQDVYNNNLRNNYSHQEFLLGLRITGYFINKYIFSQLNMRPPELRNLMLLCFNK